jgi:hypothetical protein
VIDRSDIERVIAANRYLVLGTADEDGQPWVTPVFFAPLDPNHVYWVSSPNARHSRNITHRVAVAITVFDSTVEVGQAEVVYFDAHAPTGDPDRKRGSPAIAQLTPAQGQTTQRRRPAPSRPDGRLPGRPATPVRARPRGNPEYGNPVDMTVEL